MTVGEEMRYTGGKRKPVQFDLSPCGSWDLSVELQLGSLWAGSGMKIWSQPCNYFRRSPPKQGSMPGISDLPLNPGFPGCTFFIWEPWNIPWLALQSWTSCPLPTQTLDSFMWGSGSLCGVKCACHEIRYCPFHGYHRLDNIKQFRANLPKERKNSSAHDPKPGVVSLLQHLRLEQWCRHLGFCHLELIKKSLIRIFSTPWGGIRRQQSQCKEQKLLNSLLWQWGLQTLACSYCYPEIFIS